MMKIPMALPFFDGEEERLIKDVLHSRWVSRGEKLKQFEDMFRKLIGMKYALATSSGTAALHLAMLGLNIGNGDEVITTPFSFVSSANAVLFVGAKPVFVDIDEKTMNIDARKIPDAINEKTRAILPVHVFGRPCDMNNIMKIANENNLPVVEDAAEALGSEYKDKKVGTFGKVNIFSFVANKQFTTGEGGMLVTNDEETYKLCLSLKNLGRGEGYFGHNRLGYNYHINEVSCAMGIAQLKKFDVIIKRRQELFNDYTKRLKGIDGLILPQMDKHNKYSWFFYVVRVKEGIDRDGVIDFLKQNGIESKPYFYPAIHLQKFYREMFGYKEEDFPITEKVSKSTIALPLFPDLTFEQVRYIVENLQKALQSV